MLKYCFGLIGLALLGASPLLGPSVARGGDAACGGGAAGAQAGCNGACEGCSDPDGCGCHKCCPQCGCCLVPVCHPYCEPKTITKHEYCCHCKDICVPGPEHCCKDCDGCCHEDCGKCLVRQVHKLATIPCSHQECVRKCKVEWVCPRCNGQATGAAPVMGTPTPAAPAPEIPATSPGPNVAPPLPPPAPIKTTEAAPQPPDLSTADLR